MILIYLVTLLFHGDVKTFYSGSAFLDEYDHEFFRSNATTQGVGNVQFGGQGISTLVQGKRSHT